MSPEDKPSAAGPPPKPPAKAARPLVPAADPAVRAPIRLPPGAGRGEERTSPRKVVGREGEVDKGRLLQLPGGARARLRPPALREGTAGGAMPLRKRRAVRLVHSPGRPADADRDPSQLLGTRYRYRSVLGVGGIGTVYLATDQLLNMPVAIKVLGAELTHDASAVEELKQEARITMRLSHDNIVRLYGLEKTANRYMLIMEYVEGQTLRQVLDAYGALARDTVRDIMAVCTGAVAHAHGQGILHNDLKPDNLMLTAEGVLKVIDFGTAGLMHTRLVTEYIVGTPPYMSPEQIRGETLDVRTDVYALGMICVELLTGTLPYPLHADIDAILTLERRPITGVPDGLKAVIERAIAPSREDRWDSVAAFARALLGTEP